MDGDNRGYSSDYKFLVFCVSLLCQEDAYLLELVRYIHLNRAIPGKPEKRRRDS